MVHPSGIIALEKSCGVQTHPNPKESVKSQNLLLAKYNHKNECYHWIEKDGTLRNLFLVHRLDSPTSGILLACTSKETAKVLKKSFANRAVEKTYIAVVSCRSSKFQPQWKDYLQPNQSDGKKRVKISSGGQVALTHAACQKRVPTKFGPLALLRLTPLTGRTHQLRVQCSSRNMPIIGDRTYGNFELNRKISKAVGSTRLYLHANKIKLELKCPTGKDIKLEVKADLPLGFTDLLT